MLTFFGTFEVHWIITPLRFLRLLRPPYCPLDITPPPVRNPGFLGLPDSSEFVDCPSRADLATVTPQPHPDPVACEPLCVFARPAAFGVFSTYVALYRRYPRSGSASYLPTRAAPLALAHKSYLPTPGLGGGGVIPRIAAGLRDGCRQPRRASAARLPGSSRQPAAAHLEARERLPGTCVAAKDK